MISAGTNFTACVSTTGELYCFGQNNMGQLGEGHREDSCTPQQVPGLPPIQSVSCGRSHLLCVGQDSSVWAFGQNDHAQLGLGHKKKSHKSLPGGEHSRRASRMR